MFLLYFWKKKKRLYLYLYNSFLIKSQGIFHLIETLVHLKDLKVIANRSRYIKYRIPVKKFNKLVTCNKLFNIIR